MTEERIEDQSPEPDHSDLVILDAGPILNFMGRKDTTQVYLDTLKKMTEVIHVPDAVVDEVDNRSRKDKRFELCGRKLNGILSGGHISALKTPDSCVDEDYDFHWTWVRNNCPPAMLTSGKNRGEMVLVAHARVLQAGGADVVAMIDDQDAIRLAAKAGIPNFTTVDLFHESVAYGVIGSKTELRTLYGYVAAQDDGLQDFRLTTLTQEFR